MLTQEDESERYLREKSISFGEICGRCGEEFVEAKKTYKRKVWNAERIDAKHRAATPTPNPPKDTALGASEIAPVAKMASELHSIHGNLLKVGKVTDNLVLESTLKKGNEKQKDLLCIDLQKWIQHQGMKRRIEL